MESELTQQTSQGSLSSGNGKKRALVIIFGVIAVIAIGIGYWYWQQNTFINSVKQSLIDGNYKTALSKVSPEVAKQPHSAELLALQSLALSEQAANTYSVDQRERLQYASEALQAAQSATAADAKNTDAWRAFGDAYFVTQQWSQAHAAFQKAIALHPKDAYAQFDNAQTYFFEGNVNQAEKEYQKALSIDPTLARAHAGLGRFYFDKNTLTASMSEFQKAYTTETNAHLRADDAYYLGIISMQNGNLTRAKTYFTTGTTLDASSSLPWLGLGTLEFKVFYSTSTEVHAQFAEQNPISLLANSFTHIGIATANDPNLLAAKVENAYQLSALGNTKVAQLLLSNASSTLSADWSINPEERSTLINLLSTLGKSSSAGSSTTTKISAPKK